MMSNNATPYLYIMCRNDLDSMNHGKAISHGVHAGNQFTYEMDKRFHVEMSHWDDTLTKEQAAYIAWVESARGFGTTISLDMSLREMQTVVMVAKSMGYAAGETVDPTYPYILNKEYAALIDHKSMVSAETLRDLANDGNPDNTPHPIGNDMVVCLREETTGGYLFGLKSDLKPIVGNFPMVS